MSLEILLQCRALQALLAALLSLDAGEYVADLDGMLNLLPLEALVDASSRYLVEVGTWRYVSSARALLRDPAKAGAGSRNSAVLVVNPDFDARSPAGRPLPGPANGNALRTAASNALGHFAPLRERAI
jgi:hypothetical protein